MCSSGTQRRNSLVDVVAHERCVEQERQPLAGQQEQKREEGVGDHLGEDELGSAGQAVRILHGFICPSILPFVDSLGSACCTGQWG